MPMLTVKEGPERVAKNYRSWGHYKNAKKWSESTSEESLVRHPCSFCWGAREVAQMIRTPDGVMYVRKMCDTCLGTGEKYVL